jgi:UDP-N-acetylglucosamine:LPS N-acetylglucosamine transferase
MKTTYERIFKKIEDIERSHSVDCVALDDGTKIWNLIRVLLFFYQVKSNFYKYEREHKFKKVLFLLKESIRVDKTPKNIQICGFSDADAQKRRENDYYDVFMDSLYDSFDNFIVFDWPSTKAERYPIGKHHIPLKIPLSVLKEKILMSKTNIQNKELLDEMVKSFAEEFNIDGKKLNKYVLESVAIFSIVKRKMIKKLKKVNPSIVFIRAAYGRFQMGVVQACKELGITTIELQHGLIINHSIGYIKTTESNNRDCVPDMIFTWGDFFSEIISKGFLFEKNSIKSVGFPYLENMVNIDYTKDEDIDNFSKGFKNIILVTGQEIGDIDNFIREVAKVDKKNGFVYKPHPRDTKSYVFVEENILLIDRKKDIYSLLASVDIHMTICSTTMLEALAFGVPNILVASEELDIKELGIVDNKTSYFIKNHNEFVQTMKDIKKLKDIKTESKKEFERYFKKDALKHIIKEIEDVKKEQ